MTVFEKARAAIESLYGGLCTVIVREPVVNPTDRQTEYTERTLHEGIRCRLSYTSVSEAGEAKPAAEIRQAVKLFLAPDIDVPAGSMILVTQYGKTSAYKQSGIPAVYASHQEVPLAPFDRWA